MRILKCHCGKVEAEINIQGDLKKILRCNCSLCKRRGSIMSMVENKDFKIIKGEDYLKLYQFYTKVAKHYFCKNCGIYTKTLIFCPFFCILRSVKFNYDQLS